MQESITALTNLGLNQLEAEVYTTLLTNEPMTGYRIGKILGRPTANVYKALASLGQKGAVLIEEGQNRLCRPVSVEEFLRHLETNFQSKKAAASDILAQLKVDQADDRIYQLNSVPLIIERAKSMLTRCEKIAVVDAFPKLLTAVLPAIEAAIERGVTILIQAYAPIELTGAHITQAFMSDENLDEWNGQQLNLVIDARECLLALVNNQLDQVHQALWSQSTYLSFILHVGRAREHNAHELLNMADGPHFFQETKRILGYDPYFMPQKVPGIHDLLTRYSK